MTGVKVGLQALERQDSSSSSSSFSSDEDSQGEYDFENPCLSEKFVRTSSVDIESTRVEEKKDFTTSSKIGAFPSQVDPIRMPLAKVNSMPAGDPISAFIAPPHAVSAETAEQLEEKDLYLESNFYKRIDELVILPN